MNAFGKRELRPKRGAPSLEGKQGGTATQLSRPCDTEKVSQGFFVSTRWLYLQQV
jgi:hypothetical protein